jgi:hypothetical protein
LPRLAKELSGFAVDGGRDVGFAGHGS